MLPALVATQLGRERATALLDGLVVHPSLKGRAGGDVPRAVIAQALAVVLLDDLLGRVPTAAADVEQRWAAGGHLALDHAVVRTVAGVPCGELAEGRESVFRILRPLGYSDDGTHRDLPILRYEVVEIRSVTPAAARVFSSSRDPLTGLAQVHLDRLAADSHLPMAAAESLLGELAAAFARHHATPSLDDYETLLAESDELAWIATEGTTWAHAAARVDVGRRQALHPPAMVERSFRVGERATVTRTVPGSSFELLRLGIDPVVEDEEGQPEDPEGVVGP